MAGRGHCKHLWSMVVCGRCKHLGRVVVGGQCQYILRVVLSGPCQSLWKALAKMDFTEFLLPQCFRQKGTSKPSRRFGGQTKVYQKIVCWYIADYKAFKNKFTSVLFSSNPGKTFSFFHLEKLTEKWNCFPYIILLSNDKVQIDKFISFKYGEMTTFKGSLWYLLWCGKSFYVLILLINKEADFDQ